MPICPKCGQLTENKHNPEFGATVRGLKPYCRACDSHDVETIVAPYPYKLLLQELGGIGITVKHKFQPALERKVHASEADDASESERESKDENQDEDVISDSMDVENIE